MQTFVLAEQPGGYFVLNDIFRYLSDEEDEVVQDDTAQPELPAENAPTPAEGLTDAEPYTEEQVVTKEAIEQVDEKLEEEKAEISHDAVANTNGNGPPNSAEEPVEAPEAGIDDVEAIDTNEHVAAEDIAEPEATPAPVEPTSEAAAPAPSPAPAPATEAPPTKKTWASMLSGGAQKPAVPALPITTPAQPKAPRSAQSAQSAKTTSETASATAAAPVTASTTTAQSNGWQTAEHSKKSNRPQTKAATEGTTLAYIKNVNDKVDARVLREILEGYGELKYFDVSRPRVSELSLCLIRGF